VIAQTEGSKRLKVAASNRCLKVKYSWPCELDHCKIPLRTLDKIGDYRDINAISNNFDTKGDIVLSLLSKEYIAIGNIWI